MTQEPRVERTALERLTRWEAAGGTWEVVAADAGVDSGAASGVVPVTVRLLPCTGGEEIDRLTSAEPDFLAYVT